MADYGITSTGFKRKTYNDLLAQFETDLKSQDLFGENIDFTEQDPMYQFTVPILYLLSEIWEIAEKTFYAASPKFAEGVQLSNTGKYIGIARKQATKSVGKAKFTGSPGTSIPTNFLISTENGIVFQTTASGAIQSNGSVEIPIQAQEFGVEGNVAAGTITQIINPSIGISSVTNLLATEKGQDIEKDADFRQRYDETTKGGDGSTAIAIRNHLLKVTGVLGATVKENDTNVTVNNIPAHSIYALVKGGNDDEVANAIFAKKPGGIGTYGSISKMVTDSQGIQYTIKFSRPTDKNIWAKSTITKNSNYPTDGDTLIKNAIVSYINSLSIDEDVVIYKIINAIAQLGITGIEDIQIQLSTDGTTFNTNNVTVNPEENAVTDNTKVVIA